MGAVHHRRMGSPHFPRVRVVNTQRSYESESPHPSATVDNSSRTSGVPNNPTNYGRSDQYHPHHYYRDPRLDDHRFSLPNDGRPIQSEYQSPREMRPPNHFHFHGMGTGDQTLIKAILTRDNLQPTLVPIFSNGAGTEEKARSQHAMCFGCPALRAAAPLQAQW